MFSGINYGLEGEGVGRVGSIINSESDMSCFNLVDVLHNDSSCE